MDAFIIRASVRNRLLPIKSTENYCFAHNLIKNKIIIKTIWTVASHVVELFQYFCFQIYFPKMVFFLFWGDLMK